MRKKQRDTSLQKMKVSLAALFAALLVISGCGKSVAKQDAPQNATAVDTLPSTPQDNNWQPMKDCAEQADRVLKRAHLEQGQREADVDDSTVIGSENHYSPKYERCFVKVTFVVSRSVLRNLTGDVRKNTPSVRWRLYDAFEGRELTTCTSGRVENFCDVGGMPGDCSECQKFTQERMNDPDPRDPLGIHDETFIKPGGAIEKLLKESQEQGSQKK